MITKAYRVVDAKMVEPGDIVLGTGGAVKVEKIEADADGFKFIGKKGNDVNHRAQPLTVSRGSSAVIVAGHAILDRIEQLVVGQLFAGELAGAEKTVEDADDGTLVVFHDGVAWTVPLRGQEDAWLTSVMPAKPLAGKATVPPPAITGTAATVTPDGKVESKGG